MIQDSIKQLISKKSLTKTQAQQVMNEIMSGEVTGSQFGAFVTSLMLKGETANEVAGLATSMREHSLKVSVSEKIILDTCGTGGDNSNTFNISTASGLILAGCGLKIAKHGNRAMSGNSGSADVLERLGVKINLSPKGVSKCIQETNFGFMFAQIYHPSMKFAAGPRKELGIKTVFNILGPLTNPANANHQIIGVYSPSVGNLMAEVLKILGSSRAMVVHSADGIDEISLWDKTNIWELKNNEISNYEVTHENFGLNQIDIDELKVNSPEESVKIIQNILSGKKSAARDVVLANAAAGLLIAGKVDNLIKGVEIAQKSIDSGNASKQLNKLIKISNKLE
jgi:anthranilate phosphoribosyltransferase|tara:strand:- start:15683 stop:16699 length:1017 start_codon:yes stop_codon:yes gene_type:complete